MLEKSQYDSARVKDLVIAFAKENGYDEFRKKWDEKLYNDEDHTLEHMVGDLLEQLKEKHI